MKRLIKIGKLIVNPENYRFDPVLNQHEAIELMLDLKGEEILNLAAHILENGLDQARDSRVLKKGKKYLVLDGNRRVTAIKCLHAPNLVSNIRLRQAFQNLSKGYKGTIPNRVNCYVYANEEAASEWIKLDHTGKNRGVGQDPWDAPEKERFDERFGGKTSLGMQTLSLLKNQNLAPDSSSIKLSTINRLLDDPIVRDYLGIQQTQGVLEIVADKKKVLTRLHTIFTQVAVNDLKVKEVYTDKDRKKFVVKLFKVPLSKVTPKTAATLVVPQGISKKVLTRSIPVNRKQLIPRNCVLRIRISRINKIYDELKGINADENENAAAVLYRVFLEGSLDTYIKRKKVVVSTKRPVQDPRLSEKLKAVSEHLKLPRDEKKVIDTAISTRNTIYSIDTFNSYVHNTIFHPNPKDLKRSWDAFQPFFERLWNAIT